MNIVLLACLLAFIGFSAEVSLPPEIRPCVHSSPAFAECVLEETRRLKNWFVAGLPEYGVPVLDPLKLEDFTVTEAGLQTTHRNAQMTGLRDCEVVTYNFNEENKTVELILKGNFVFTADYSLNGQLLLIPLRGKGKSVIELIDTTLRTTSNYDIETAADGLRYLKLYSGKTKGKYGNVKLHMEGLLGGNNLLSNAINHLLNENWRELMKTFGPPTSRVINQQINKLLQSFFDKFPYDQLFPEQ